MKTSYDVLGVRPNASDETIKVAFRKAAKACHPDLNAGDPTAELQLRQVIAAYEILKKPERRAAYDWYLRISRRSSVRGLAMAAVATLLSGIGVPLVVWLLVSLSNTQEASGPPQTSSIAAAKVEPSSQQVAAPDSGGPQEGDVSERDWGAPNERLPDRPRHLQQSASGPHPTGGRPESQTLLAEEWEHVQASDDPRAIWAFVVRNPDAPESELARSKLIAMIDTAEDVYLLHLLRLVATDAIAERAQERLVHLGALAVAKEDEGQVASPVPSSSSLEKRERLRLPQTSVGKTVKAVNREDAAVRQLVGALKAGGFVIVHRYTGRMPGSSPPALANMIDAGQRLSPQGRADAQAMGGVYRRLNIPVSDVLSSEYFLVYQAAAVAFGGRVKPHSDLTGSRSFQDPAKLERSLSAFRARVANPPPAGANVVLWTHEGKFKKAFGSSLSAGETVVFGRHDDGVPYEVARLSLREFLALTE